MFIFFEQLENVHSSKLGHNRGHTTMKSNLSEIFQRYTFFLRTLRWSVKVIKSLPTMTMEITKVLNMESFCPVAWGNSLVWNSLKYMYETKNECNLTYIHISIIFSLSFQDASSFFTLFFLLIHQLCSFVSKPPFP